MAAMKLVSPALVLILHRSPTRLFFFKAFIAFLLTIYTIIIPHPQSPPQIPNESGQNRGITYRNERGSTPSEMNSEKARAMPQNMIASKGRGEEVEKCAKNPTLANPEDVHAT
jgi:hypothetical protein